MSSESQVEEHERDDSPEEQSKALDVEKVQSSASIADTLPLWREILFVGIISAAQFTTQVGLGQCLAILHVIGNHYNVTNPGTLSWLIAGYSLTVGTFILVAGRFGDLFGYKRMLVIGYIWFSIWSMIAGLAYYSNHVLFTFARAFQGIGPAITLPNGIAVLGATYGPSPRKNMVFAIFGATAPAGAIIGAVFAGIFNLAFWPWTFWSTAIVLACLAVATALFVPDPQKRYLSQQAKRTLGETISRLDPLGGLTGIMGLVLINFAWNQAGVVTWKAEPYVWVTLILGFLFVGAFFFVEAKISRYPLLPFGALNGDVGFVLGLVACGWGCFGIDVYYLWNFFLVLKGASPLHAAAWAVPLILSGGFAAISTGLLLSKLRPAWVMLIAMMAFCIGTIIIATAPVQQTYWAQIFVCML